MDLLPRALVLDFDGTLTQLDVGDALCDRFAGAGWKAIGQQYARGELSLPVAQEQMWALFRGTTEAAQAYAREVGALRPGADALLEAPGWTRHLGSGGFHFYIEAILGPARLGRFHAVHTNTLDWDGERVVPRFNAEGLACHRCAVCKGKLCARLRDAGAARVVFVGDGHSDTCVLDQPFVEVHALAGGALHRAAVARGARVQAWTTLSEVVKALS
jgi:phosphoserine phosphatase